ncbi:MAG: hypothetical protein V3V59_07275 [Thermodesulfovibrionales bacterium]
MFTKFTTTGIGSMPHTDPSRACEIVLKNVDIPFWPQLPKASFRELMIPQYSEGMPSIRIDEKENRIWLDSTDQEAITSFYESYTEETEIPITDVFSKGFYAFLEKVKGKKFASIKGHVTGPLTFTLGLKDEEGRPVFFNEELREISLMALEGNVRWQVRQLNEFCDRVMIFIDEPILSAIGTSSYMGVSEEEVRRLLDATVSSIKGAGGISAIHCCGKADWKMVMECGIDVVNFDAYDYFENFQIYSDALVSFLERGGYIAWGIVPTDESIKNANINDLKDRVVKQINELSEKLGSDDFVNRIILTPSCGAGSLGEEDAEKVFEILHGLKQELLA